MNITDSIKAYICTPHTGALLINGSWGCGKTYYIKNTLLEEIRGIPVQISDAQNDSFKINGLRKINIDLSKHQPVLVSVFGKNSIDEIETEIFKAWLESVTDGKGSFIDKGIEMVKHLWGASEYLNEKLDLSKLLNIKPGLSMIPDNTVIILDDLERISDEIDINLILGFVNDLVENKGFKVILVANEEKLSSRFQDHDKEKEIFKEKVVERGITYIPPLQHVFPALVKDCALGLEDFQAFMTGDKILNTIRLKPIAVNEGKAGLGLRNLRTLKFAINHFRKVYEGLIQYQGMEFPGVDFEELKLFCWTTILGLSIEMKEGRLDNEAVEALKKFSVFNYNPFASDVNEEESQGKTKIAYSGEFYNHYLKETGFYPIVSTELVEFIVNGKDIDYKKLLDDYSREMCRFLSQRNEWDDLIEDFLNRLPEWGNEEFEKKLTRLYEIIGNSEFTELGSFLNATYFLLSYRELLGVDSGDIKKRVSQGVNHWFESRKRVHALIFDRFDTVKNEFRGGVKEIADYIAVRIDDYKSSEFSKEEKEFLDCFRNDISKALTYLRIQPLAEGEYLPRGVVEPFLGMIDEESLSKAVEAIKPGDVYALEALMNQRYNQDFSRGLFDPEKRFWEGILKYLKKDRDKLTAGSILAQRHLVPQITDFLRPRTP